MSNTDVIPKKDGEFSTFQQNLVAAITANAVAWSIDAGDIAAGTSLGAAWDSAYALVTNPATKTQGAVDAKNTARAFYEAWMRPFIQRDLYRNPAVTTAALLDMGLKPHDTTRSRVSVPDTIPQIDLSVGPGFSIRIFFRQEVDAEGNSRRGKPDGVALCEIAYVVGINPPVTLIEMPLKAIAMRSPLVIIPAEGNSGKRIYVAARWVNTRGEGGPWSTEFFAMVVPG